MTPTEQTIKKLIVDNEGNKGITTTDPYGFGYYEGYHDALVDAMNQLGIKHNEEFYNE